MRSISISVWIATLTVMQWIVVDQASSQTVETIERPALVSSGASANVQALPIAPTAGAQPTAWPNSVEQANWNTTHQSNNPPQSYNQLLPGLPVQQVSAQSAAIHSSSPSAIQPTIQQVRDQVAEQESSADRGIQLRPRTSAAERLADKP